VTAGLVRLRAAYGGTESDFQVAAPTETRTPTGTELIDSSMTSADGRMATAADVFGQNSPVVQITTTAPGGEKSQMKSNFSLTPAGLLMEGLIASPAAEKFW